MFSFDICRKENCHNYVTTGSDFCYRHSGDREKLLEGAVALLKREEPIRDFCITEADFQDIKLSGRKEFISSNFAWCTFRGVDFTNAYMTASFFDFCLFDHCLFRDIDCRYTVFSGSKLNACDFSLSFIVHSNFAGIDATDCDFSSSNLYFSNFTSSFLRNVSFEDCDVKKCDFRFSDRKDVSFRYSNYQEARV